MLRCTTPRCCNRAVRSSIYYEGRALASVLLLRVIAAEMLAMQLSIRLVAVQLVVKEVVDRS
eukprot:IDg19401t1